MNNIGIILPDLSFSQMGYECIKSVNRLLLQSNQYDITLFYEQISNLAMKPLCGVMNLSELWSFNGTVISTTIDNTIMSLKAINKSKKIFYVYNLEWLKPHKQNYMYNIQAYRSPNITLAARNSDHAKAIQDYCGRKVNIIVPNFQIDSFIINEVYNVQ